MGRGIWAGLRERGYAVGVGRLTIDPTLRQEVKIEAADGAALDKFGWTVAVSGSTAIVGDVGRGLAYIFARNGATWSLQARLEREAGFGKSVAISGNTAVVGSAEKAHVFVRGGTQWTEEKVLTPGDPAAGDHFGNAVAVSGDTAVVGAPFKDNRRGAAYVFVRSGAAWSASQRLPVNDRNPVAPAAAGDAFGASVAIDGNTLLVGAPTDNAVGDITSEGSVYVYVRSGGAWTEQAWLTSGETAVVGEAPVFGLAVGISGDFAIVGRSNEAFTFQRIGTVWSAPQPLLPNAGEVVVGDRYGESVGISGQMAIVGANATFFFPDAPRAGAAYLFSRSSGAWTEQARLEASDAPAPNPPPPAGDGQIDFSFGWSVAVSGDTALVGAPFKKVGGNRFQGGAYVYQSPDADGDGLPDAWETSGITVDSAGRVVAIGNAAGQGEFIDLPKMGAHPLHKDIFVHVDWMAPSPTGHDFKPNPRSIRMVIDSFAVAPVDNPDGRKGIDLHVDAGPLSIMKYVTGASETWGALSRAGEVPFQETVDTAADTTVASTLAALAPIELLHFTPAQRSPVFHYALYCEEIDTRHPGGSSAGAEAAAAFLVAFDNQVMPITQASTFMHELGHNLGLDHGGGDDVNYKPNYISIMNYRFNVIGTLRPDGRQRSIDFSRRKLATLDETKLDEFVGIADPDGHLTTWNKYTRPNVPPGSNKCLINWDLSDRLFYPTDALDWDCDGVKSVTPVAADLNNDAKCIFSNDADAAPQSPPSGNNVVVGPFIMSGPNRVCETLAIGTDKQDQKPGLPEPALLEGFDDWANPPTGLIYDGGGPIGNVDNLAKHARQANALPPELPLDELMAEVPPGLLGEEALAPLDVVTVSPQGGESPLQVLFDGGASTAVSGTITDWAWDFGDGASGTGASVLHTYNAPGEYFASLTVTDSNGHVNLVPLLQHVEVLDPTIATVTPATTPTPALLPTATATPPPGSTPTRTATPVLGATPTRTPTATPTPGVSLVVTTAADNGSNANPVPGSLRQALLTANATANPVGGVDVITFDIPGAGVQTIAPPVPLPAITDPVTIDGYTQPGASANTLTVGDDAKVLIEIDASSLDSTFIVDLRDARAGGSTVRGLAINRVLFGGAVLMASDDNVVEGCFIGINAAGDARRERAGATGAGVGGILVYQGANNRIGGTLPAARNVILGNGELGGIGVGNDFLNGVSNTLVQGNYIGTNAAGSAGLNTGGIAGPGVEIGGVKTLHTVVGGTQAGAGNLISGNGAAAGNGFGILIGDAGDVTIQGNLIGTNAQGTAGIGNPSGGISTEGTIAKLVIGGPQSGARNVIAGNGLDGLNGRGVPSAGITLYAAAPNGITVQGNFIGTGSDGVSPIPNFIDGIGVVPALDTTYTIGGLSPGEGNVIAGNARHGIQVRGSTGVPTGQVAMLGNSIFVNGGRSIFAGGLGIDLQGSPSNSFQVTSNDPCDPDDGPNGLQNSPVLTLAGSAGGMTTITGGVNSKAGTQYRIEFFSSPVCDASGNGEGHTFLAATTITTSAGCDGDVGTTVQPAIAVGQFITATATDPNGNTSEFSNCVPVTGDGPIPTFTIASTPAATSTPGGRTPTPSPIVPSPTATPSLTEARAHADTGARGIATTASTTTSTARSTATTRTARSGPTGWSSD